MVTELPINPLKVWREFRTRSKFITTVMRQRECLQKCHGCGDLWRESETKFVHTAQRTDKTDSVYFCDGCLKILDDE